MEITVAAIQMACEIEREANIAKAEQRIREAARGGANVIVLPELFETHYFCKDQHPSFFDLAHPRENHPMLARFSALARELGVVLPVSFFERAGLAFYNALAVIDADGSVLGVYRKSHIPDGPGYQEKFYFNPGDTGFRVWATRFGRLGIGICWDQWFPETARVLALRGAELLIYPTAIGSEPRDPDYDSSAHWRRVMQGHAGANMVPLVAVNRIGEERGAEATIRFYGTSFFADATGAVVADAGRDVEAIIAHRFDLQAIAQFRRAWGVFRDRRPDLYGPVLTLDGSAPDSAAIQAR